jgi:hypothetical protein
MPLMARAPVRSPLRPDGPRRHLQSLPVEPQSPVIPGLVPGVHVFDEGATVDGRDTPGHDDTESVLEEPFR